MGMGSSALEAERLCRSFGGGCALAILPTCVLPTLGKVAFRLARNVVRQEIQGGGYKKLDAQDFLRGTSSV